MKTFFSFLLLLIVISVGIILFKHNNFQANKQTLIPFTVALDWTPNTNHTGMYVALQKGWYKEAGLDVKILPYGSVSPDVLVTSGKADVGVGSTESIVADAATGQPVVSIAAILAHNTSGFIALADSINRPKDLDNKIYGGFGAPYEGAVVGEMIKKDGGTGNFKNVTLDVAAMDALKSKKIDFVWIFQGWEGIQAQREGLHTVFFPITSFGIPDYYTPTLITSPQEINTKAALLKKFMQATKQGYDYAIAHPKESAQILIQATPKGTFPDTGLVFASQEYVSKQYADKGEKWGVQKREFWHGYPQFMLDTQSVLDTTGKPVTQMNFDALYTNEFVQ